MISQLPLEQISFSFTNDILVFLDMISITLILKCSSLKKQ